MSMTKWVHDPQFIPGTLVRAESINDRFNGISSSIESIVDTYEGFSIRLPANFEGQTLIPEQTLTNKIFYLDENGDITLYSLDTFDTAVQLAVDKAGAAADSAAQADQIKTDTNAIKTEAQRWANESYGIEISAGLYSGKHWSEQSRRWSETAYGTEVATGKYSSLHWSEQAKKWSETAYNTEVEIGLYSAKHWAEQARLWSETAYGTEVASGAYSALHWSEQAKKWATTAEDTEVKPGSFSAYHYMKKAEAQADRAESFADALDVVVVNQRLDDLEILALAGL